MRTILVTNDDGIGADGIARLVKAAKEFGEVFVVAPDEQRSAASHSITLTQPVDVYPYTFPVEGVRAFRVSGTPGDCIRLAVMNLMETKPDVVLSGINYGYNVAMDLQYSATAGGAFEAAFLGYRAIAFSEGAKPCHEVADAYLEQMIKELIDRDPPAGHIWNVNFPPCALADCRGILRERTVSRRSFFNDSYEEQETLPDGGRRFLIKGHFNEVAEEGSDLRAVHDHYVSVGAVSNVGV